jgi:hypothetical protein
MGHMREEAIRRILAHVCSDLDSAARRSAGPAALGATLLVAAGCGSDSSLPGPTDAGGEDAAPVVDSGTGGSDAGTVTPVYSVPVTDASLDDGPVTKYGVPVVDSGPVPPYMAPSVDAGGPVPDYMAPLVDGGPIPVYMVIK